MIDFWLDLILVPMRDSFESWYGQGCIITNQAFSDPYAGYSLSQALEQSSCWHLREIDRINVREAAPVG